jgi:hypothetical protein
MLYDAHDGTIHLCFCVTDDSGATGPEIIGPEIDDLGAIMEQVGSKGEAEKVEM